MNTIDVAKQAVQLVWRRKYLWLFGIFVGSTMGGNAGNRFGGLSGAPMGAPVTAAHHGGAAPAWAVALLVAAVLVGLAVLVLRVISTGALVASVRREHDGLPSRIREGFRAGAASFWRVLGITLGMACVVLASTGFVAAPAILGVVHVLPLWLGIAFTVLLALPAILWLLTVNFTYEYALRFAVLERRSIRESVRASWRFLHGRIVESLKLLLTVLLGGVAGGVLSVCALVPAALVGLGVYAAAGLIPALVVGGILALPLVLVATGITGAFSSAVWTLGFLEQHEGA